MPVCHVRWLLPALLILTHVVVRGHPAMFESLNGQKSHIALASTPLSRAGPQSAVEAPSEAPVVSTSEDWDFRAQLVVKPVDISDHRLPPVLGKFLRDEFDTLPLEDWRTFTATYFEDEFVDPDLVLSLARYMQKKSRSKKDWLAQYDLRGWAHSKTYRIHHKELNALALVFDLITVNRYLEAKMDPAWVVKSCAEWAEFFSYLSKVSLNALDLADNLETMGPDADVEFTRSFMSSLQSAGTLLSLSFLSKMESPPPLLRRFPRIRASILASITVANSWRHYIRVRSALGPTEKYKAYAKFHQALSRVARRCNLISAEFVTDSSAVGSSESILSLASVNEPVYSVGGAMSWSSYAELFQKESKLWRDQPPSTSRHELGAVSRSNTSKGRVSQLDTDTVLVAEFGFKTVNKLRECGIMANRPNDKYFVLQPRKETKFVQGLERPLHPENRGSEEPNTEIRLGPFSWSWPI
ncbi:hypothetical protein CXG81DRAFT_20168 [Caulochytrium protostelioides]|uniref:Uncharacterized protein n=1 Tax=Caulochytrium protostelioides TaxID=1555241 RepID=A0A4P9X433_9FUNG|nr:hypothetical protein CXG81DRAFT_20168 [Caulochytrium protostelioides]|eukprot:RKO99790.1 hypothetical protein CXG81DRAFT_20168 [Caulochytrium protostelioides]